MTVATQASKKEHPDHLSRRMAVVVFLAFALAYFFSALVRAITATLSPTLTTEFSLDAQDLGLLAGGEFVRFSLTQLPLGRLLDRHGPKKVVLSFLSFAVLGCLALMLFLPALTWLLFVVWLVIGLNVYFFYSRKHSQLANDHV